MARNGGGGTNPNKWFRITSTGALEIINSAYTSNLLSLSDAGALSVPVAYQVSGKQAVNGPAFSAYAAAVLQTIPNDTLTKVLFQTEEFDTNNNYASSRFTPTVEGYYQLNAEVRLDGASGTGEMMIMLYKNGTGYKRGTNQSGTQIASNFWAMQVSTLVYANGTSDYFEIYVQQGSGGSVSVTAVDSPAITWFNGCMMRGA
jgi:aspartate aminotransferase-like enzyme